VLSRFAFCGSRAPQRLLALIAAPVPSLRPISVCSDSRPHDRHERIVPIGTSRIVAVSSIRNALETDQENCPALLLPNSAENAQRQPSPRIGCRGGEWPGIVKLDGHVFARRCVGRRLHSGCG
jgi:hypothetical protein